MSDGRSDGSYNDLSALFNYYRRLKRGSFIQYLEKTREVVVVHEGQIVPAVTFGELRRYFYATGKDVPLSRRESDNVLFDVIHRRPDPVVLKNARESAPIYDKMRRERMKALRA